jgi:UDP-2,3-diacylglucosamine pyrophosphatase LpxH
MADIRYVCLSDTHFGEEDSLFTNLKTASVETDPLKPSPVMIHLAECLRALISTNETDTKPTLILAGDILELALATTNEAAMVFERFLELMMPKGDELFQEIIYIPGNHDHHLWELARETQYVTYFLNEPDPYLKIPWHTTNLFIDAGKDPTLSFMLTNLSERALNVDRIGVRVAYPNFGLFDADQNRCVVFTHGHFVEPLYQLISTLKSLIFPDRNRPEHIWDIEAENFAWIDFFWSTMGRSGEAGQDIERIYEKLHDKEALKRLLNDLVDNLADKYDLPGLDIAFAKILKMALGWAVNKMAGLERTVMEKPLSDGAEKGLREYFNGPVYRQIHDELKITEGNEANVLSDVTLVFGHTHKPFQEDMNFRQYPAWVNVYNTGGWIVESVDPEPLHGGSIVLVDQELNAASLSMYKEADDPDSYAVKVEEATRAGQRNNPFYLELTNKVDPQAGPWKTFSEAAARSIRIRAQNLRARIIEGG